MSSSHECLNAAAVLTELWLERDQEQLEAAVGVVQAGIWGGGQRYCLPMVKDFPEVGNDLGKEQGASLEVAAKESEDD